MLLLIEALKIVVFGMVIVFVVLSLLGAILYLIGKVAGKLGKTSSMSESAGVNKNTVEITDDPSPNNCDTKEILNSANENLNLADDAFIVAAIAACHYVRRRRHVMRRTSEMSAWLLFGRRALLSNVPPRDPWRR